MAMMLSRDGFLERCRTTGLVLSSFVLLRMDLMAPAFLICHFLVVDQILHGLMIHLLWGQEARLARLATVSASQF